ncbi:MAG: hypothetical protein QF787_17130, partial [Nitrospinota bacterium]|nr:hypothetical protein [Nitrospinota bacterium]
VLPHLSFMAFLQRVVNGGGEVLREYAAGRKAVDLVVTYGPDRFVVELKRVFTGGRAFGKSAAGPMTCETILIICIGSGV